MLHHILSEVDTEDKIAKIDEFYKRTIAQKNAIEAKICKIDEKQSGDFIKEKLKVVRSKTMIPDKEKDFGRLYSNVLKFYAEFAYNLSRGQVYTKKDIESVLLPLINHFDENDNILDIHRNIQIFDVYLNRHAVDSAMFAAQLGRWLDMPADVVKDLAIAGLLHDVGKVFVSRDILKKTTKLEDDEFEQVKRHCETGYKLLRNIEGINERILDGVLEHHEKLDGSGYPKGIAGDELSTFGRIIGIVDIFSAMILERTYGEKYSSYSVVQHLNELMFSHLDPSYTTNFIVNLAKYNIGNKVLLNNGMIGDVVMVNKHDYTRPIIKVDGNLVDLSSRKAIHIVKVI